MKINQTYYSLVIAVKYGHTSIVDHLFNDFKWCLCEKGKHFRWFMAWMDRNDIRFN